MVHYRSHTLPLVSRVGSLHIKARHWVPTPMPISAHVMLWVGMGAI